MLSMLSTAEDTTPPPVRGRPHWIFEALLIVVSVALGFAVSQLGAYRDERQLAEVVLTSLHEELERNRERLEPYLPMHSAWVEALDSTGAASGDQSGFDVFMATRPPFPADASVPFPVLRRSAWDAAVSGGALRLIDYDLAALLSEIYRLQEIASDNLNRLANGAFTQTSTFDPSAREASIRLL
jgi:hypothetical protein